MFTKSQKKIIEWRINGKIKVDEKEETVLREIWHEVLKQFDSRLIQLHAEDKIRYEIIEKINANIEV